MILQCLIVADERIELLKDDAVAAWRLDLIGQVRGVATTLLQRECLHALLELELDKVLLE